nr:hypothetical protein [Tanacetum cinerariifolium]
MLSYGRTYTLIVLSHVMSTTTHINSETISQTDRAQSSRLPIPLPDDPYMAVRIEQPSSDHTPTSSDPTPVSPLTDEEFTAFEPSNIMITSSHSTSPSDSTTPLFPDHLPTPTLSRPLYYRRTARMDVRTQPTVSHGLSARVTEAMTLSPSSFHKWYKSSYKTLSPSSLASSPTLPIRKRYQGTSELIKYTEGESLKSGSEREGSKDKGHDSKEKEAAPEGQPQQAVQVMDTAVEVPLELDYRALRHRELALGEGSVPSTFEIGQSSRSVPEQHRTPQSLEWSSNSLPVSSSFLIVPTLVASPADSLPVASPATIEAESFVGELGAHIMPPKKTTTLMIDAAIKELIAQGVAGTLVEYKANRSSGNSDDSYDSRSGRRRTEHNTRECTYSNFLKCQPFKFKGTEGVNMMADKYCPMSEIKKLDIKIWNLKIEGTDVVEKYVGGISDMIQGSVMASKPKIMQEAIEFADEPMDQKIYTFAERQDENKRKLDNNSSDNNT